TRGNRGTGWCRPSRTPYSRGDRRDPQSTSTLTVPRHTRTGGPSDGSGLDGPERGLELRHVRDLVGRGRLDRLRLTEVEEVEGHGHTVEVLFAFDVLDRDHHLVDQTVVGDPQLHRERVVGQWPLLLQFLQLLVRELVLPALVDDEAVMGRGDAANVLGAQHLDVAFHVGKVLEEAGGVRRSRTGGQVAGDVFALFGRHRNPFGSGTEKGGEEGETHVHRVADLTDLHLTHHRRQLRRHFLAARGSHRRHVHRH